MQAAVTALISCVQIILRPYPVALRRSPEKVERFHGEIRRFVRRWGELLEKGDPFYNPNLSLKRTDFSLRDKKTEPRIGVPEIYKNI